MKMSNHITLRKRIMIYKILLHNIIKLFPIFMSYIESDTHTLPIKKKYRSLRDDI